MGNAVSSFQEFGAAARNRKAVPLFVVSLDALGTLYGFREPIVVQYLKAARQCGMDTKEIRPEALQKSFRTTFKHYNKSYPNYGKGQLKHPEEWWTRLLEDTFTDVTRHNNARIPSELAPTLYEQFSSKAAYELYPDARSFMQSMRALKTRYSDPDGPLMCVGVVTNSDPRAGSVLESLGLQVGPSKPIASPGQGFGQLAAAPGGAGALLLRTKYDQGNDVDFLATSYDAGVEKPAKGIWEYAERFTQGVAPIRAEKSLGINIVDGLFQASPEELKKLLIERFRISEGQISWLHIGDEVEKDYKGARRFGHHALHLERVGGEGKSEGKRGPAEGSSSSSASASANAGIHTISSLEDAAMIVNVMAQDHFKANPVARVMDS